MGSEVSEIGTVNSVAGNGTGSARKRKSRKQALHHEEHDTVVISEEAKRRLENDALDEEPFDEGKC